MKTESLSAYCLEDADGAHTLAEAIDSFGFVILRDVEGTNEALIRVAKMLGDINLSADEVLTGPPIMEMRVNESRASQAKEPAYFTADKFPLHTDLAYIGKPPKYLLMHCVRPDPDGGGATVLSDCQAAFDQLSKRDRDRLATRSFMFRNPPGCPSGYAGPYAVHAKEGDRSLFRFKQTAMEFAEQLSDAVRAFAHALSLNKIEYFLQRNELVIVDNHRWTHGRTAFGEAHSSDRLLRRAYAEV